MSLIYVRILRFSLGASVLGYDSSLCGGDGSATPSMSEIGQFRSSLSLISPTRKKSIRACLATDNVAMKRACEHCFNTLENATQKSLEALTMSVDFMNDNTNNSHDRKYPHYDFCN